MILGFGGEWTLGPFIAFIQLILWTETMGQVQFALLICDWFFNNLKKNFFAYWNGD